MYNICLADKSTLVTPIDIRLVTISLAQRNLLIYKPGVESVNIIRDNLYQNYLYHVQMVPYLAHQNYIEVNVPLSFLLNQINESIVVQVYIFHSERYDIHQYLFELYELFHFLNLLLKLSYYN